MFQSVNSICINLHNHRPVLTVLFTSSIADDESQLWTSPCAERVGLAFLRYSWKLPDENEQPLRVYVHASHDKKKLRRGRNEFQVLVNQLPMATLCSEARAHAVAFSRAQIPLVNSYYIVDADAAAENESSDGYIG